MTGGASLFNLLAGAARVKIVAVLLGTSGVGVISYLVNFVQLATSVTTLGIGSGVVKLTSEMSAKGEEEDINRLKATSFSTTFWFSVFVSLLLLSMSKRVSLLLMGDLTYTFYFQLASLSIPFVTLGQSLTSVLNGFSAIRELALTTVWAAVISLMIVTPLVWKYRITGVVWHLLLQSMAALLVVVLFYQWRMKDARVVRFLIFQGFDRRLVRKLASFGLATFLLTIFQSLSFLFVRKMIQHQIGEHGVGLYQVPFGFTLQYLNIVLTALLTYSLPTMSALHDDHSLRQELNQTLRASLLVIVPVISILLVFKKMLIILLYSREFLPSVGLLEVQLVGDFFKVIAFVFGVVVLSRARLVAWLLLDLFWDALFVGLSYVLLPRRGLSGVAVAFLLAYCAMALGYVIYAFRGMNLRVTWVNVRLMILSFVALSCIAVGSHRRFSIAIGIGLVVMVIWTLLCFRKREIKEGLSLLRNLSWRGVEPVP